MKLYQPQQHLSYLPIKPITSTAKSQINAEAKIYLKSTISVLVNAGETLTRVNDKNPLKLVFRAIGDQQWQEKHIVQKVILIDEVPLGPNHDYIVKVIVYKMDGSVGGQVTSTISENDTIEIEE
ncbi:MAG: hypothetical protein B6D64_10395 [Bacteroidetes bacterium 4484_276]|nr:MAG: hypothetical protein B6D64_10395 [Bacteroidetes bacterium 4484_276]